MNGLALLVVSPHLDDAVLSCGQLLAAHPRARVATVFAGEPDDGDQRTAWDHRSGFGCAREAIAARRAEDAAALRLLRAEPIWLPFCDGQYGQRPRLEAVREAIGALLRQHAPRQVGYPLGLYHDDHRLAHEAVRAALRGMPDIDAWAYEDVPYRSLAGVLQQRLAALAAEGIRATPRCGPPAAPGSADSKARALRAYASQLRPFGEAALRDAAAAERGWHLEAVGSAAEAWLPPDPCPPG